MTKVEKALKALKDELISYQKNKHHDKELIKTITRILNGMKDFVQKDTKGGSK